MSGGLQTSAKVGIEFDYIRDRKTSSGALCNPIAALMLATLADALRIYAGDKVSQLERERRVRRNRRNEKACYEATASSEELREVEAWIAADNYYVFGFAGICDALGIDAASLRARLPEWRKYREPGAIELGDLLRRAQAQPSRRRISQRYAMGNREG